MFPCFISEFIVPLVGLKWWFDQHILLYIADQYAALSKRTQRIGRGKKPRIIPILSNEL